MAIRHEKDVGLPVTPVRPDAPTNLIEKTARLAGQEIAIDTQGILRGAYRSADSKFGQEILGAAADLAFPGAGAAMHFMGAASDIIADRTKTGPSDLGTNGGAETMGMFRPSDDFTAARQPLTERARSTDLFVSRRGPDVFGMMAKQMTSPSGMHRIDPAADAYQEFDTERMGLVRQSLEGLMGLKISEEAADQLREAGAGAALWSTKSEAVLRSAMIAKRAQAGTRGEAQRLGFRTTMEQDDIVRDPKILEEMEMARILAASAPALAA